MTDTHTHEFKMQCMARQLLSWYRQSTDRGRKELKQWLGRYEKRHGKEAKEQVQHYLKKEHLKQEQEAMKRLAS